MIGLALGLENHNNRKTRLDTTNPVNVNLHSKDHRKLPKTKPQVSELITNTPRVIATIIRSEGSGIIQLTTKYMV